MAALEAAIKVKSLPVIPSKTSLVECIRLADSEEKLKGIVYMLIVWWDGALIDVVDGAAAVFIDGRGARLRVELFAEGVELVL